MKFADDISQNEKNKIKENYGLSEKAKFASGGEVMALNGNMPVERLVEVLNRMKGVEHAGFDYIMRAEELDLPDASEYSDLWGMEMIGAPGAWALDQGNPEVVVAVIDTGVDMDHEDLAANIWTNPGESGDGKETDGIDNDGNGYVDDVYGWDFYSGDKDPSDEEGHGTHCAGTIAAASNGIGVAGVAPNVGIMPLRFLGPDGSGSFSDAILAIEYAKNEGAHVISASWGGYAYSRSTSDEMYIAIDDFDGLFVAAAGNEGVNTDSTLCRLWGIFVTDCYHLPSTYSNENIVSIASVDEHGNLSSFSNYGPVTVDIAAPGGERSSNRPDGQPAVEYQILSTVPNDGYDTKIGTSMATPHVAGTVALMISHEMNVNGYGPYDTRLRSRTQLLDDLFAAATYDGVKYKDLKHKGLLDADAALQRTPGYGSEPPPPQPQPENEAPYIHPEYPPYMTGTFVAGGIITAHTGTWIDEGDLDYYCTWQVTADPVNDSPEQYEEWYDPSWTELGINPMFFIESGQVEKYIRIEVVAVDAEGLDGTAYSDWAWIAPNEAPVNDGASPDIDGLMIAGERVYAVDGGWSDDGGVENLNYSYMWQMSDTELGAYVDTGVETDYYDLTAAEATKYLRVLVTATDTGDPIMSSEPADSPGHYVAQNTAPVNDVLPAITGTLIAGETAYADTGDWDDDRGPGNLSYSYNWLISDTLNGTYVDTGETGSSYQLGSEEANKYIKLMVKATDEGDPILSTDAYSQGYYVNPNQAPENDTDHPPTITGTFQENHTIYAEDGIWTDDGGEENLTYTYKWLISDTLNGTYVDTGETGSSYQLGSDEANKYIKLMVKATDKGDPILSTDAFSQGQHIEPEPPTPLEDLTVEGSNPANGARGVGYNTTVIIDFSHDIAISDASLITLAPDAISGISIDPSNPDVLLIDMAGRRLTRYTLTIPVGAVEGIGGEQLTENFVLKFRTGRAP